MGPPGQLTGHGGWQALQGPAHVRLRRGVQDQHDPLVVRPARRHRRDQVRCQVTPPGRCEGDDLPGRGQHGGHGGDQPVGRRGAASSAGNVRDQRDAQDVGRVPGVERCRAAQVGTAEPGHRQQEAGQGADEGVARQLRSDLAERPGGLGEGHRGRRASGLRLRDLPVELGELCVEGADLSSQRLAVGGPRQRRQSPKALGDLVTQLGQRTGRTAAGRLLLGEKLLVGGLDGLDKTHRPLLGAVPAGDREEVALVGRGDRQPLGHLLPRQAQLPGDQIERHGGAGELGLGLNDPGRVDMITAGQCLGGAQEHPAGRLETLVLLLVHGQRAGGTDDHPKDDHQPPAPEQPER